MNYVIHSGVKGQKWGVRRYQNEDGSYTKEGYYHRYGKYPNEYGGKDSDPNKGIIKNVEDDYIIKKDTTFKRATTEPNEKFKNRTYVSGYDGAEGMVEWLPYSQGRGKPVYLVDLKTKRDTVIAGKNTVKEILKEIDTDKSKEILKELNKTAGESSPHDVVITPMKKKSLLKQTLEFMFLPPWAQQYNNKYEPVKTKVDNKPKEKSLFTDGKPEDFLYLDWNDDTSKAFIKELKKRGYSGLSDPMDALSKNATDKDAVIFVNDVLKKVGEQRVG